MQSLVHPPPDVLQTVPNIAVSYTSTTITATSSDVSIFTREIQAVLPLGTIAAKAGGFLKALGNVLTIPVSATATAFGAVVCAAGP